MRSLNQPLNLRAQPVDGLRLQLHEFDPFLVVENDRDDVLTIGGHGHNTLSLKVLVAIVPTRGLLEK